MNYDKYRFNFKEIVKEISIYIGICAITAYVFYRSVYAFIILLIALPGYLSVRKKNYVLKRKKRLKEEFSEDLYSVAANLRNGYSIENAFLNSISDLQLFYGSQSIIKKELQDIKNGIDMNQNIESRIEDFAIRSGDEDICLFSEVLLMAKRNGGNIPEVMSGTADRIREKICTDREIDLMISEKKLELRIMEVMPFLIPFYLNITSGDYFNILYTGIEGKVVMTGCLVIYVLAVYIAERIMRIEM